MCAAPTGANTIDFQGIAYGNGRWVIVGEEGTILSSPDGMAWTSEINPAGTAKLDDVAFGNGLFLAMGHGNGVVVTSPDGREWTEQTSKAGGALEIIHDGTQFVALAAAGVFATSTNGASWVYPGPVPTLYVDVGGIAFGNGTYVAAAAPMNVTLTEQIDARRFYRVVKP